MNHLVWFREDLRMQDNPALHHAANQGQVAAIYLIVPTMWEKHHVAAAKVDFILRGLKILSKQLEEKNIALIVKYIQKEARISEVLLEIAREYKISKLFFNKQYEVNESHRDNEVIKQFNAKQIEVSVYDDQCVLTPGKVLSKQGEPLKVFTPFKRSWIAYATEHGINNVLNAPRKQNAMLGKPDEIPESIKNFKTDIDISLWDAGEKVALTRLNDFIENKLSDYHRNRDYPYLDGTSKLSPYLNTGMISIRQCFDAALKFNQGEFTSGDKGAQVWMSELIWREFYRHILYYFPDVCKNQPFKKETKKITWNDDEKAFNAWKKGETGFPLVDAAMRQLKQTGWMHNRLRMVVAMFLTKSLFIHWQLGEQYFMENLIDGDFSSNNGGWQWCASTGVDAAPYFRIFNPLRQSERFDKEGDFIKQYLPELKELSKKQIHEPYKHQDLFTKNFDYPKPIVDHQYAKQQVIEAFKSL